MKDEKFRHWLEGRRLASSSVSTRISDARRVEHHYGDLDEAYESDHLGSLLDALAYNSADQAADRKNPARFEIEGNVNDVLSSTRSALVAYRSFRDDDSADASSTNAERIRLYVSEKLIAPARTRGETSLTIRAGDVHEALGLVKNWANVCQVLRGRKLREACNLPEPTSGSPTYGAASTFTFDLVRGALVLDPAGLAKMRERFLLLYPDFTDFARSDGAYFAEERSYKEPLIAKVAEAAAQIDDEAALGATLLDILTGQAGTPSGLLGWRTDKRLKELRASHPGVIEQAAGVLARSDGSAAAMASFNDVVWPMLAEGMTAKPYSESRNIVTMLAALVRPDDAYGINTNPLQEAAVELTGSKLLGYNSMTPAESIRVHEFAEALRSVMRDTWNWGPRDLWDVQGFVWAIARQDLKERLAVAAASPAAVVHGASGATMSTNLILHGPPGTGKTFETAIEAVRLCERMERDDPLFEPDQRAALMEHYHALVRRGRVAFVTFHQSYSYEEFVEGLRPTTGADDDGEGATTGFSLRPHDGIFKQIAILAGENRGSVVEEAGPVIDRTQKAFKMSLGRSYAAEDEHIFQDAIRDGHVVLGYGGDVDWSDRRFDNFTEIKRRWQEDHPDATGNDPNIAQVFALRAHMQVGSYVVISDGNRRFRAIGQVTGPYQYRPGERGEYNHRRPVRWLWHSEESLPRERIYSKELSQVSAYELNPKLIDWDALEQIVAGGGDAVRTSGVPEPYVLVLDEINRANISKVFGELITLIEPDKRIGALNEIRVTLPYSRETFGVPANLHIVGTMNTADRSIALLDTALRRRFEFRELMPRADLLGTIGVIDLRKLLTTINERIEYLFDREHQVGHAFFIGCGTEPEVDAVMRYKVIPLLAEYFHEDWDKVALVLGDLDQDDGQPGGFLVREPLQPPAGMGADDGAPRYRWVMRTVKSGFDYARLQ